MGLTFPEEFGPKEVKHEGFCAVYASNSKNFFVICR
jgi:hypothetical protein